jgi:hypothetical protein
MQGAGGPAHGRGARVLALAALLVAAPATPVVGQAPLNLEVRAGLHDVWGDAATRGVPAGAALDPGASFGLAFAVRRGARGYLLVGFSQHRAGCGAEGCGRQVTTQWEVGWRHDLGGGDVVPWLRAAAVVPRVEGVATPDGVRTSETGYGAEAGVGLRVALGGRLHLAPGVRAGWGRVAVDGLVEALPLGWVVGDVAVVLAF